MEQHHVLPPRDEVLDRRQADLIFSRAWVKTLVDVVVVDPASESNVVVTGHVPGHKAAGLKEEALSSLAPDRGAISSIAIGAKG